MICLLKEDDRLTPTKISDKCRQCSKLTVKKSAIAQARTQGFASFSQQYEVIINGVAAAVELKPQLCPLAPCPLKMGEQSQ